MRLREEVIAIMEETEYDIVMHRFKKSFLAIFLIGLGYASEAIATACPYDFKSTEEMEKWVKNAGKEKPSVIDKTLDLNLDGRPDIILGVACKKSVCNYYVFLSRPNGEFYFAGNAVFNKNAFRIIHEENSEFGLLTYLPLNATKGKLVRYRSYSCIPLEKMADINGNAKNLKNFIKTPVEWPLR